LFILIFVNNFLSALLDVNPLSARPLSEKSVFSLLKKNFPTQFLMIGLKIQMCNMATVTSDVTVMWCKLSVDSIEIVRKQGFNYKKYKRKFLGARIR